MAAAAPERLVTGSAPMLAGRTIQFALLTVVATAALFARTALSPLQETIRLALALTDNQLALLQGPALALAPVIVAIPLGVLVDRQSRVRLLLLFAAFNVVGTALTALAPNFAVLFAARCFVGLAHTVTSVAAFSLLADLYREHERGRANMIVLVGQIAGMSGAFALGGALVSMSDTHALGWRWAMLWLTAPLVPIVLLTMLMREPQRAGHVDSGLPWRAAAAQLWALRRVYAPILGGLVMTEVAVCAVLVWATPTLIRNFALGAERVGAIMSTSVLVAGIVGSIAGGFLADHCQRTGGPRRTLLALCALAAVTIPTGLFSVAGNVVLASALLVVFLTVVDAAITMAMTLLTVVVSSEVRGLALATAIGANTLFGVALTPLIVSGLSGALGGTAAIGQALAVVCVLAGILGVLLFSLGRRNAIAV
jgi:MFS family permease